jgi:prevent-host-death family protein
MRPLQLATDVVSIGELKVQAARILQRVKRDRCPVVITQHGKPAGVLVSPEDFDRLSGHARFLASLEAGLADVEAGRVIADEDLDEVLEAAFKRGSKKAGAKKK